MWTTPSRDSLFNDHPLAHSMPGAGVVHHIIRDKGGPPASPVTKEEVKSERSQLMHLAKVARA
jgi:hypothetical protein